jgi:hypothetical protein
MSISSQLGKNEITDAAAQMATLFVIGTMMIGVNRIGSWIRSGE